MNPAAFPLTADMYTDEQIGLPQVAIIVELLVKRDARDREAVKHKVYQKIAQRFARPALAGGLERVKGIEPSTRSLGSYCSTTELHPHGPPL